jgi:hypothetical protein
MMTFHLRSNRSYLALRLAFWRFMAFLAEFAIQYKPKIQPFIPFVPLMGYGLLAYLFGLGVGEILKTLIG